MNRVSSILGAIAIVAIAVVFVVQFRPATNVKADTGPVCAVEVSGTCVSSTEFWAAYRMLAPGGADASRLRAMGLRRQTGEGLVERHLLTEDAKRLGITVSDEELTAELAAGRAHISLPADKARQLGYALGLDENMFRQLDVKDRKTKKFDMKAHEKQVRSIAKMSPTDFREFQRQELVAARMRDLVRSRARVGESEAFTQFSREKSTASLAYVKLDRRFYGDIVVDTSPRAIDAWVTANQAEADKVWESRKAKYLPECRVARHVLIKLDPNASDPDAEKDRAKKKAEEAKKAIADGQSFEEVARTMSDDGSAEQGGDLGCVQKGQMVKPFEDALFAMKAGDVSDVVESQFGFHVLKLEQIATGEDAERLGKAQTLRELYLSHESERLAAEGAKEILAAVRAGKSLEDALAAHLAAIVPASKKGGESGNDKADKKDATKKKKGGEEPAEDAPAADERMPVTAETHPARPKVDTTLPFNAAGDPIEGVRAGESVATIAFGLQKAGDVPDNVIALDNGYAVIQLKEKTAATDEEWQKNREFYVSAMRSAKQNDALVAYVKRLKSTLGGEIKYNAALVEEPKAGSDEAPAGDDGSGEE